MIDPNRFGVVLAALCVHQEEAWLGAKLVPDLEVGVFMGFVHDEALDLGVIAATIIQRC